MEVIKDLKPLEIGQKVFIVNVFHTIQTGTVVNKYMDKYKRLSYDILTHGSSLFKTGEKDTATQITILDHYRDGTIRTISGVPYTTITVYTEDTIHNVISLIKDEIAMEQDKIDLLLQKIDDINNNIANG